MSGCQHCLSVRAERDELAERVRLLESVLFDRGWVPDSWGLTPSEVIILNVLALRRLASKDAIHFALYGGDPDGGASERIIDVMICKLRKKLQRVEIEIQTVWGFGYRLQDTDRLFLTQLWKAAC